MRRATARSVGWIVAALILGSAVSFSAIWALHQVESNQRLTGMLVRGSLSREGKCEFLFVLESEGVKVPVRYSGCLLPDTLRDMKDVQVTAEGKAGPEGRFEATSLMAKNGGLWEMDHLQKRTK